MGWISDQTSALRSLAEEGFALPSFGEPSVKGPDFFKLAKGTRQRVLRREAEHNAVNQLMAQLECLLGGEVDVSKRSKGTNAKPSSLPGAEQVLRGASEDLRHFGQVAAEVPGSEEEAFFELTSSDKLYGGRPDIAGHGQGPISLPAVGSVAEEVDDLLKSKVGDEIAKDSEKLLEPNPDLRELPKVYWDPAVVSSEEVYAKFIDDLLHRGLVELTKSTLEEVGLFFCGKADGVSLRLLVDARRANRHFRRPPKVDITSPSGLAESWVDSDEELGTTGADIKDYFYMISLPAAIRKYFGLKPVKLALLTHPSARALEKEGLTHAPAQLVVCPMGFSWSLWTAQKIHEGLFENDEELSKVSLLRRSAPAVRIRNQTVAGFCYVDDNGLLGVRGKLLDALHQRLCNVAEKSRLPVNYKKSHGVEKESVKLGFRIDGIHAILEPKPEKWVKLVRALRFARRMGRVRSRQIEYLLGNACVFALLRRPFLSIFGRLYEAVQTGYRSGPNGSRVRLSRQARAELRCAATLAPLLVVHLKSPPSRIVGGSDSSGTHVCTGITVAKGEETVFEALRYDERIKFEAHQVPEPTARVKDADAGVARLTEEAPADPYSEVAETVSLTYRTAVASWKADEMGLRRLLRKGPRINAETEVRNRSAAAWCIFPSSSSRSPSGVFWSIGEKISQTSLWAAHEGLKVGLPFESSLDCQRNLLGDAVFDEAVEFIERAPVRWLHVSHETRDWAPDRCGEKGRRRPLFLPDHEGGRPDATLEEGDRITNAIERLRRELFLLSLVREKGGQASREGPWFSGVWQHPLSRDFQQRTGDCTVQLDQCCFGRHYRRTTRVDTGDPVMQRGTVVCPGREHPKHRKNLSLRGMLWRKGYHTSRVELAEVLPVPIARWVARCVALAFEGTERETGVGWSLPPDSTFPRVSADLVEEATWECLSVRRWKYPEEIIFLKEARGAVSVYQWIVLLPSVYGKRILGLVDNEGVVLRLNRGRSRNYAMLRLERIVLGTAFLSRTRPKFRHLQGHRHPCDALTRPHILGDRTDILPSGMPAPRDHRDGPPGLMRPGSDERAPERARGRCL